MNDTKSIHFAFGANWARFLSLLDEDRLNAEGFLNPQPIRARWKQHLNGQHNWRDSFWLVLMFQAWMVENNLSAMKKLNRTDVDS